MADLIHPASRQALAAQILSDIDDYCKVTYNDGYRTHLGASIIGAVCDRALWYGWRWVLNSNNASGRMERLWNRGHQTEPRFIEWLRGVGFTVWDKDPATGDQYRITNYGGHFGGSCDGVCMPPARYGLGQHLLLEFKTHNEKSFTALKKASSVKTAKPLHFAQMCVYGYNLGLKYALYCAINKNNDDVHLEIVELDWKLGEDLTQRRSVAIISAQRPPPRLHENSTHVDCKMCDFHSICHSSGLYALNCRSCDYAVPTTDGQWWCGRWGATIPKETLPVGCPQYQQVGRNR